MRHIGRFLLTIAGALAAGPVMAQSAGTIELGAFGRWTRFSDSLKVDVTNKLPAENGFGGGLRLGIFIIRNLALEADASYTKVDAAGGGKVRHIPIHGGLTYNIPLGGKFAFLLGARAVRNSYGEDAGFDDWGIGGVGGFRLGPIRIEATVDRMLEDDPDHGKYTNVGVNAGLSLLLGGCNKSADGVTVSPSSATLDRGQKTNFTATATRCGKSASVNWTATGGEITQSGEYTAGQTPGDFQVTATEPKSGLSASATVTIKAPPPPPPPPPPVTLSRIELTPEHARVKPNEAVAFTVTGINSDGTTRALTNCTLTATGNATKSGNSFSWTTYGTYTVTATCDGMTDTSTVEVPLEVVIYGANFAFDRDQLTRAGLDSVRAAADSLKKYPEIKVRLAGHADFMGTDAYNCNLSWRRVHTVHKALNSFGIPDDRFTAIEGFGEAYPIPDSQVPQEWKDINTRTRDKGKWWDRRVEITSADRGSMQACAEPNR
ncbi:MAG TPA: OmpA family protein [Gemmatimonadales bacterium]|jgi:outer membrane protein OmpA-like peptidoglycan-associated protein|nr:OmpA family protein [Gemmatimonadales bacterium]